MGISIFLNSNLSPMKIFADYFITEIHIMSSLFAVHTLYTKIFFCIMKQCRFFLSYSYKYSRALIWISSTDKILCILLKYDFLFTRTYLSPKTSTGVGFTLLFLTNFDIFARIYFNAPPHCREFSILFSRILKPLSEFAQKLTRSKSLYE